jgi:hypothetical protein
MKKTMLRFLPNLSAKRAQLKLPITMPIKKELLKNANYASLKFHSFLNIEMRRDKKRYSIPSRKFMNPTTEIVFH